MRFGILGTGMVGDTIAKRLKALGHEVKQGGREAKPDKGTFTFAETASFGEMIFNCTNGMASVEVCKSVAHAIGDKVLVDVSNPLDFSKGMPPSLFAGNTDSLAERIQAVAPKAKVVKALNTVNCAIMVEPAKLPGDHDIFVCGDDGAAKAKVVEVLRGFGWKHIVDLGPLQNARGTESYLPLWVRLYGALGTPDFNIHIVRKT
jgi:hypothetical protein